MDILNRIVLFSLGFLYLLMHILGQLPYSVNIRTAQFATNRFWFLYSVLFVSALVATYFGTGLHSMQFKTNETIEMGINRHMKQFDYFFESFVAVSITVVQILNTDQTVSWNLQVREVYLKVRRIVGESPSSRDDIIFFALGMLVQFFAYLVTNVLIIKFTAIVDDDDETTSWITMIMLTIPILVILLCANMFSMVAICLANCLSRINDNLASELKCISRRRLNSLSQLQKVNVQINVCEKIEELDNLHSEVYDTVKKMDRIYSSRLFLIMTYLFLDIIGELYFICDNVTKRAKDLPARSDLLETFGFFHLFFLASELYFITNAGERLKRVSMETGAIIHKILLVNLDIRLENMITEFSLRLKLNPIALKPMQLFEVDNLTLYHMAHGMTTYLIILVQYKMAESFEESRRRNALLDAARRNMSSSIAATTEAVTTSSEAFVED